MTYRIICDYEFVYYIQRKESIFSPWLFFNQGVSYEDEWGDTGGTQFSSIGDAERMIHIITEKERKKSSKPVIIGHMINMVNL